MADDDHERLASEMADESKKLSRESARLEEKIDQVRSEWHRKQHDSRVPGAVAPEDELSDIAPDEGESSEEGESGGE